MRNTYSWWIGTILLAVAIASVAVFVVLSARTGPRMLVVDNRNVHIETDSGAGLAEGQIEIRSIGSEPLEFSIVSTCTCSNIEPQKGVVNPGRGQVVRVGVKLDSPGTRMAQIRVETNDKVNPAVDYRIAASWHPPLVAHPSAVDFGNVVLGDAVMREITVSDQNGRPVSITTAFDFEHSKKEFDVIASNGKVDSHRLQVRLSSQASEGFHRDTLVLRDKATSISVFVPITARVLGQVSVTPSHVILRPPSTPSNNSTAVVHVWTANKRPLGKLKGTDLPEGVSISEINRASPSRRSFRLSPDVDFKKHFTGSYCATLRFENLDEPVIFHVVSSQNGTSTAIDESVTRE